VVRSNYISFYFDCNCNHYFILSVDSAKELQSGGQELIHSIFGDDSDGDIEIDSVHRFKGRAAPCIIFTEIDCTTETAEIELMVNKYNIEGYPTIKLLKDGQVIEYDAKPSKATLEQFLNTVL
jgi:hypothetical protein